MKMKRLLSASIAAVMAVGLLAGCNGAGSSSGTEKFEDSEETLTLKWLGYHTNAGASEGTLPEQVLEEKFNVDIQPLFYEENKFNDKKTMLMAGGEIPDLLYELDPVNVINDVEQDFIVELPYKTIKKFAPEYYAYLNEYSPDAWLYSRYEDANWGLPNYNHSHMISKQAIYRGDWLEKFGLEVPKTLDEMHTALYKFANEDPDGNGKADTYGISCGSVHWSFYFPEIFGAYGALPFDWVEKDGKIVYGGVTEECKTALQTLATWYSEGIVHPDFVLGTSDNDKMLSGQLGYMSTIGFYNTDSPDAFPNKLKTNQNGTVALGFLPIGPDGQCGSRAWGRACHVVSFGNTEGYGVKVPRMLKMFEGMFTDFDLAKKVGMGNEGEHYQEAPADFKASVKYQWIGDLKTSGAPRVAGMTAEFAGPTFFRPIVPSYEDYKETRTDSWNAFAAEWTDEKYSLTGYFFKPDIVPSSSDYMIDLRTQQMSLMSEIITGVKTIDAYEEFVQAWNNGGGAIMTEEANELKGQLEDIYKELKID